MFDPDTVIKVCAVSWLIMVVGWAGYRLFFRWCWKHGKVTIDLGDKK